MLRSSLSCSMLKDSMLADRFLTGSPSSRNGAFIVVPHSRLSGSRFSSFFSAPFFSGFFAAVTAADDFPTPFPLPLYFRGGDDSAGDVSLLDVDHSDDDDVNKTAAGPVFFFSVSLAAVASDG